MGPERSAAWGHQAPALWAGRRAPCHARWSGHALFDHQASCSARNGWSKLPRQRIRQPQGRVPLERSEEHTSELQSLMRISYAVFCLKKKKNINELQKRHEDICQINS